MLNFLNCQVGDSKYKEYQMEKYGQSIQQICRVRSGEEELSGIGSQNDYAWYCRSSYADTNDGSK